MVIKFNRSSSKYYSGDPNYDLTFIHALESFTNDKLCVCNEIKKSDFYNAFGVKMEGNDETYVCDWVVFKTTSQEDGYQIEIFMEDY